MSMSDCHNCQTMADARSMTSCARCGCALCPDCAREGGGYCMDCLDDDSLARQ